MKDMYSYSTDEKQHEDFYQKTILAYNKCYERFGIGKDTFVTFAAGGAFTEFSHEFQTICEAGEDEIYINREKGIAINEEVYNSQTLESLGVTENELEKVKTAEVGNIFNFGTKKCEEMNLHFNNEEGKPTPVFLGSYGIGITRVMGVIADKFSDEKGLVWPESVAPFKIHLIVLGDDADINSQAENIYKDLMATGVEVLFDDRVGPTAGEKFSDADLLGMPIRVVVSKRSIENGGVEIKKRIEFDSKIVAIDDIISNI